jgi:hypothetical protein
MTVDRLRTHAHELARAFHVRLCESTQIKPDEAFALGSGLRLVVVSPIIDETTYAVALHELGHLVSPMGMLRAHVDGNHARLSRDEEDAAWTWAEHVALLWTPPMAAVRAWAEGTYADKPLSANKPKQKIDWKMWS